MFERDLTSLSIRLGTLEMHLETARDYFAKAGDWLIQVEADYKVVREALDKLEEQEGTDQCQNQN